MATTSRQQRDDVQDIRAALTSRTTDLAINLLGPPNPKIKVANQLRWNTHGSFSVIIRGSRAGIWRDHETQETGDLLALIRRVRGGTFPDALDYARAFCGMAAGKAPPQRRVDHQRADDGDDAARSKAALTIWRGADSISAPIAAQYFDRRKLIIPDGIDRVALRFHPHCPFGPGTRHPAVVALYRDVATDEPRAISRTALTPEGAKIDRKMLGPIDGTACKMTPDQDVEHSLHIAEGIETAVAGMMLGFAPMWALGSAGAISKFLVLAGIEALTILCDNDPINPRTGKRPGEAAAIECADRWAAAGREVVHIIPDEVGEDMADIVERQRVPS